MINLLETNEITHQELKALLKERQKKNIQFFLLDVREEEEYNKSRIIGVDKLMPTSEFNIEKLEISKETPIIIYCRSGVRSYNTQQILKQKGYNYAINLLGGIIAFQTDIAE